jgi:hypothetical protein
MGKWMLLADAYLCYLDASTYTGVQHHHVPSWEPLVVLNSSLFPCSAPYPGTRQDPDGYRRKSLACLRRDRTTRALPHQSGIPDESIGDER